LNWNSYTGFDNSGIANYTVEQVDQQGNIIQSINNNLTTSYTTTVNPSSGTLYYRVRVNASNATQPISYSNTIIQSFDAELYVPTIFTPNNDSNNDEFVLKGKYINQFKIMIFNRWGEQVFESNDIQKSWDGLIGLNPAPSAAYTWSAQYTDQQGKTYNKTGTVTLIR
jgi:gliding motility-associated-like protein